MHPACDLLVGRLEDKFPAYVSREDFDGKNGSDLRLFQHMGLIAETPGMNPRPSCPFCLEGVPYASRGKFLCNHCGGTVPLEYLQLWEIKLESFLRWFADAQRLHGGIERLSDALWYVGDLNAGPHTVACFYVRTGDENIAEARKTLKEKGGRSALAIGSQNAVAQFSDLAISAPLEQILFLKRKLRANPLGDWLEPGEAVHFIEKEGVVTAGRHVAAEIRLATREYHFFMFLYRHIGEPVSHEKLADYVKRKMNLRAAYDPATFNAKIKGELKKCFREMDINLFIRSSQTSSGEAGYCLRRRVEIPDKR